MATIDTRAEAEPTTREAPLVSLLAEFSGPQALMAAAAKVRDAGFSKFDCYTPFPLHGIDDAMGIRRTRLPFIVLAAAATGGTTAFALQAYTNATEIPGFILPGYQFWISGKPFLSLPSMMPVIFELSVLFAAFGTLLGMLALNGLPRFYNALFAVDTFRGATQDKFFLEIPATDPQFEAPEVREFLTTLHPVQIVECREAGGSAAIPKVFFQIVAAVGIVALIPLALTAQFQAMPRNTPRMDLVWDMDWQSKLKTQKFSPMFADGRGMRAPIEGTVARGFLNDDDEFMRGLQSEQADEIPVAKVLPGALDDNGQPVKLDTLPWVTDFPVEVTAQLMDRGEQRFGIYCAPCHGQAGHGDGLVTQRANQLMEVGRASWVKVTSFHDPRLVNQPHGQIFNTITHGAGKMPAYGAQIKPADRWAIVLYLRALQRSQRATLEDVPADMRANLPELVVPGMSPAGDGSATPAAGNSANGASGTDPNAQGTTPATGTPAAGTPDPAQATPNN